MGDFASPSAIKAYSDAYWPGQDPRVRALKLLPDDSPVRLQLAQELAHLQNADGSYMFLIDFPIMVVGWDPGTVMAYRALDGYTWVPNAMQPNIMLGPGLVDPGYASYDPDHPPPGSILVSLVPLVAFDPPPPPRPPLGTNVVGSQNPFDSTQWAPGPGAYDPTTKKPLVADGQEIGHDGVVLVAHLGSSPFGGSIVKWFTLKQ